LGVALPAGVPAVARSQDYEIPSVPARVSGAVTAAWHADPATCAAHGLCGFSGSVTSALSSTAEVDLAGVVGRALPDEVDLDAPSPATVRVRREGPGDPATCVDSVDAQAFLGMEPGANGRVAIPLGQDALRSEEHTSALQS